MAKTHYLDWTEMEYLSAVTDLKTQYDLEGTETVRLSVVTPMRWEVEAPSEQRQLGGDDLQPLRVR